MFALVENGVVVKHPYSATDLKRAHKEVSFPKNPTDAQLADWNVLRVFNSTPPTFNALTEVLEETTPIFTDNRWTQVWSVRAATAEELAARQAAIEAEAQAAADLVLQEDAKAEPLIAYLVSHTAAEIKAKVNADITDLASAKLMLGRFGVALAYLARQGLR